MGILNYYPFKSIHKFLLSSVWCERDKFQFGALNYENFEEFIVVNETFLNSFIEKLCLASLKMSPLSWFFTWHFLHNVISDTLWSANVKLYADCNFFPRMGCWVCNHGIPSARWSSGSTTGLVLQIAVVSIILFYYVWTDFILIV